MAEIKKGVLALNFGLLKVSAEITEEDRQCAWEFYTEISTRVAVIGKINDWECANFEGEVLSESLESLYGFFQETRRIMRRFPVGKLPIGKKEHLGAMINEVMERGLRPFLEKWQSEYRYWWEYKSNPRLGPKDRQEQFPEWVDLLNDWTALRLEMRKLRNLLISTYSLVDTTPL